jgi:hypothetical protein
MQCRKISSRNGSSQPKVKDGSEGANVSREWPVTGKSTDHAQ